MSPNLQSRPDCGPYPTQPTNHNQLGRARAILLHFSKNVFWFLWVFSPMLQLIIYNHVLDFNHSGLNPWSLPSAMVKSSKDIDFRIRRILLYPLYPPYSSFMLAKYLGEWDEMWRTYTARTSADFSTSSRTQGQACTASLSPTIKDM